MKYFIAALLISVMTFALPTPYDEVDELLPYDDFGWYFNAPDLEKLVKEQNAHIVIELGSWLGKSTRHIASLLPEGGVVYAVDHWLGSVEHQGQEWHSYLPSLYQQFLSNTIHAGLCDKIVPVRMMTLEAVELFKENHIVPDIVYVDASHDEESVYKDLVAYYPFVVGHGVLCGDDWNWSIPGMKTPIQRAVKRFAKEQNLDIKVAHNWFWALYPKQPRKK